METIKKFKLKIKRNKKRKKANSTKKQKGKVGSRRRGGLISRKEGRLNRTKDYVMIFYFLIGSTFLTVMILLTILGTI